MRRVGGWDYRGAGLVALVLLLALVGIICPAGANTNVFNGAFITADGLTMTVGSCTERMNTTSATMTSCGSTSGGTHVIAELVLGTGIRGAAFSLASKTGGALFTGLAAGNTDELKFTLTISADSTHPVNFAQLSMVTSGSGASSTASASEGAFAAGFSSSTLSLLAAGAATTSDASNITSSFALNYDIKLVQGTGGTLQLTSVTSIFNPAPEPLSAGVFVVGLVGLGAARRARRKISRAA